MHSRMIALSLSMLLISATTRDPTGGLSPTDSELAVARLALGETERHDVRSYGRTMIADHARLDPQLRSIARGNDVALPKTMKTDDRQSYDHLESLTGTSFDDAFTQAEARDHRDDIAAEQKEIGSTVNPQVRALIEQLKSADTHHAEIGGALQHAGH